jgi:hypothetical protein
MIRQILLLTMLILTACTAVNPTPADSGVQGQVFIGPMCPVVQEGQECPDKPYQAVLTVNSPTGERIVQIQTEKDGTFQIPLPPGEYILHPESPNVMPFASEQAFTIEEGKFTQIVVTYDSGIR